MLAHKNIEFYIPMEGMLDTEAEIEKLEKELNYTGGFLKSVMGKLNNERFVQNAPEKVVEVEKAKQAEAESKIKVLESQIMKLKG